MRNEPDAKRAVAFFDGQNLFHAARQAFGYTYPNFQPVVLAQQVCKDQGWQLTQTRFYTGVPDRVNDAFWNHFWLAKLGALGHRGVHVFSRPLRYRHKSVSLSDGTVHTFPVAEEKGIDVRIAIDVIRLAHRRQYDVALIFSQDQDLSEAADEIREIAREQNRWLKIASAFPVGTGSSNRRGINKTDWIAVDKATYDACLDPKDYRPRRRP